MSKSLLFVPGSAPDKYRKAATGDADALILDLEDSVAPSAKPDARRNVVEILRGERSKPLWVRVNALETGLMLEDLVAVVGARPFGIMVPKCCGRETLAPVVHYLDALEAAAGVPAGQTQVLPIATETARSLFHTHEYVNCTPRLWGLTWGAEDLSADIGSLSNRDARGYTEPYRHARTACLFAATAAGVRAIDTVSVSIKDPDSVRQEAADAFRDGFVGKMAIHPAQVAPINEAFTPSAPQREWSQRVIAAFEARPGQGALSLDGQMIDIPHLRLARRLLGGAS